MLVRPKPRFGIGPLQGDASAQDPAEETEAPRLRSAPAASADAARANGVFRRHYRRPFEALLQDGAGTHWTGATNGELPWESEESHPTFQYALLSAGVYRIDGVGNNDAGCARDSGRLAPGLDSCSMSALIRERPTRSSRRAFGCDSQMPAKPRVRPLHSK